MEPFSIGIVVGELSAWPEAELATAYRLMTAELVRRHRSGSYGSDPRDDSDLEADAHQFGVELMTRGLI